MRYLLAAAVAALLSLVFLGFRSKADAGPAAGSAGAEPVLVELFTSEGCSSCPPADALLGRLDAEQSGGPVIVLSEHVDYWNHIGWTDPFSSEFFSKRQSGYARRFGLESIYTPQMVVDGSEEFVGSDAGQAGRAIQKEHGRRKLGIRIASLAVGKGSLTSRVEAGPMPSLAGAEVYAAVALNHAESQVLRGENGGKLLAHVAVVRSLARIGTLDGQGSLARNITLRLDSKLDPGNLRLVVFAQQPDQGAVVGSAVEKLDR